AKYSSKLFIKTPKYWQNFNVPNFTVPQNNGSHAAFKRLLHHALLHTFHIEGNSPHAASSALLSSF
ncbi:hypothetical protein, partial [Acetobacter orientalis]|uniref:hypothetical protein n=1 Tax=Acetobacter orientalis TaxID=146474 RepID=UPI0039E85CEE